MSAPAGSVAGSDGDGTTAAGPTAAEPGPAGPRHEPGFQGAATTRPTSTTGVVTEFDTAIGLGTVRAADGIDVGFHCTQIADGSRHIDVGLPVDFVLLAGRHGCWEAGALRPRALR